ncbi:MAG: radical SAM protein [Planctomycetota bacterium]|nr:radical SAM protein [Planctomycetota bacterium]
MISQPEESAAAAFADHTRRWRSCRYVYPVLSRRAGGLSIGVNLNPEKACNFACVYCQVDRKDPGPSHGVDVATLRGELRLALGAAMSGQLWDEPRFASVPARMRRLNDIALSGDGEPTCVAGFDRAVHAAADARAEAALDDLKLIVITNATRLDSPPCLRAIGILRAHNGELWAKLDVGSEERFGQINRPRGGLTLRRVLDNIALAARLHPVVLQTMLFRLGGEAPARQDLLDYAAAVRGILDAGGVVRLVQLYTVARPPAEASARPLSPGDLNAAAALLRDQLPGLTIETFAGLP